MYYYSEYLLLLLTFYGRHFYGAHFKVLSVVVLFTL